MIIVTVLINGKEYTPEFPVSTNADEAAEAIFNCCNEHILFCGAFEIGPDWHGDVTANVLETFFEHSVKASIFNDVHDMLAPKHHNAFDRLLENHMEDLDEETADIERYGSVESQASADYSASR